MTRGIVIRRYGRLLPPGGHRPAAVLAAAALLLTAGAGLLAPKARADANLDEVQFVAAINTVRAGKGLAPLATDGQLINVARSWSSRMAGDGVLSHNPSLASQISDWRTLGENVGTGPTVASIEAAFEASPHHYANIVDPAYNYVGVGVVELNGTIWVTEDFKQSKSGVPATAAPAPAPPPSAKPAPKPAPNTSPAPKPAPAPHPTPAAHSAPDAPAAAGPTAVAAVQTSSPESAAGAAASGASSAATPGQATASAKPGAAPALPLTRLASSTRGLNSSRLAALLLFAMFGACAIVVRRRPFLLG
jgi:uncharacterized protein YkwD